MYNLEKKHIVLFQFTILEEQNKNIKRPVYFDRQCHQWWLLHYWLPTLLTDFWKSRKSIFTQFADKSIFGGGFYSQEWRIKMYLTLSHQWWHAVIIMSTWSMIKEVSTKGWDMAVYLSIYFNVSAVLDAFSLFVFLSFIILWWGYKVPLEVILKIKFLLFNSNVELKGTILTFLQYYT